MNDNYRWYQKILHELMLSQKFFRVQAFLAEHFFYNCKDQKTDQHVFICGLPRAGSSILLNTLYEKRVFASITFRDVPFILAPNLWGNFVDLFKKPRIKNVPRAHDDGLMISEFSPEAFEEVFWDTFDQRENDIIEKFKLFINSVQIRYNKDRYISKNNQNVRRIELLAREFTNSQVIILFRSPVEQCGSLLQQHKSFLEIDNFSPFVNRYMKLIGHKEFGVDYDPYIRESLQYPNYLDINHWIEQWIFMYQELNQSVARFRNIYLVCYDDLVESVEVWVNICNLLEIDPEIRPGTFKKTDKRYDNLGCNSKLLTLANELYCSMRKDSL